MLKLGKIIREKKCKIIQKSTTKTTFIKLGGGLVSTDTLNSEAIIINTEDYNSKSMGVL